MIDVQVIPATEEHLQMILPDVRQADIDELYAVSLMTTEDALRVGLRTATMAWSGFANGELAVLKNIRRHFFATAALYCSRCWQFIRAWKTTSTSETMLPKHGCTGLDSGLKKPRLMVLLVLISTDFTWRENNV